MNILDTIIAHKRTEVAARKAGTPASALEKQDGFNRKVLSLKEFLLNDARTGIIAEFKRKSPSKGLINGTADVVEVTSAYAKYASGLSVLTDENFFGGSTADLVAARVNQVPILRKDFIVDEYQVLEARAMGADVILLIAACLTPEEVKRLATFATQLGLEVLLELHDEEELEHICDETILVGINNRNLKTFKVDIERSLAMAQRIPDNRIKIAESGISAVENILLFRNNGFRGFLIGENFMKAADPAKAFEDFVQELKTAKAP
ncbi:indole-3-glycerol phosphate synthase TrpC [Pseudoflavitalea rhizosphaerae]|uniref:indole-3-glycerol phosphate synthase TrpC n=1 Tax=Pseudoflavitalea rhizosphaerae TaxID=1884793 RepID=UPI000F8DEBD4|nr:indole-3-glycerol phosphate synthase TrpC [Pseudoflavitalea rhizosphaerae]